VYCIEERDFPVDYDEPGGDCSWDVIAGAIREHAKDQPSDVAEDLCQWADLVEGIGALSKTRAA
jgi:hypothetical protein